jgi:hypothetical protein
MDTAFYDWHPGHILTFSCVGLLPNRSTLLHVHKPVQSLPPPPPRPRGKKYPVILCENKTDRSLLTLWGKQIAY